MSLDMSAGETAVGPDVNMLTATSELFGYNKDNAEDKAFRQGKAAPRTLKLPFRSSITQ